MEQAEALRQELADCFTLQKITADRPERGHIRFRGYFTRPPVQCYDELRSRFERHGFTPLIRHDETPATDQVLGRRAVVIALPTVFDPPSSNWVINLVLLLATIFSVLFVAAFQELAGQVPPGTDVQVLLADTLANLGLGLPFAVALMLILGAHELGHYFAARHHNVPVTLPYFIPFPISIIGTMGAFIRLKAPVTNKRALLDIGAAGPLAGMVFALPILVIGLLTSDVGPLPPGGYLLEGNSILYALLKVVTLGRFLPADGIDVSLNQLAWAGWVGLLVTSLNLIPVGQLDGGHVAYVLFGRRARRLFIPVLITLGALFVVTQAPIWIVWAVLLLIFGRVYAVPLDDVTELDGRRRAIAIFTLILFLLVFMPNPLCAVEPGQDPGICLRLLP